MQPKTNPKASDKQPPSKLRNIVVAATIIVGVTIVWLGLMYFLLKIFAAGYVVLAWVIMILIAYFVLRNKNK